MILDGREVPVPPGASILETARAAGTTIPTLCHHPALPPDGSCRVCLVEIDGRPGLHPACVVPAHADLVVRTDSPPVQAARRHVIRLGLGDYRPGLGKTHNELLTLAARYDVAPPPAAPGRTASVDESNPFIRVDHGACIRC